MSHSGAAAFSSAVTLAIGVASGCLFPRAAEPAAAEHGASAENLSATSVAIEDAESDALRARSEELSAEIAGLKAGIGGLESQAAAAGGRPAAGDKPGIRQEESGCKMVGPDGEGVEMSDADRKTLWMTDA